MVLPWPVPEPGWRPYLCRADFSEMPRRQGSSDAGEGHWMGIHLRLQKHWLAASAYTTDYVQPQPAGLILGGLRQKYSWEKWTKNSPLFILLQFTPSDDRPAPFKLSSFPVIIVTKPRGWLLRTRKACIPCWFIAAVVTFNLFLLSSRIAGIRFNRCYCIFKGGFEVGPFY